MPDFKRLTAEVDDLLAKGWITRGVGKAGYQLHNALDRAIETRGWDSSKKPVRWLEHALLRKFQREAHLADGLASAPAPNDTMEWLATMRHFGAPTRLLDWSYSPWIALFFAATSAAESKDDVALWGADAGWLKHATKRRFADAGMNGAFSEYERDLHCRHDATFVGVYSPAKPIACVLKQNCWRSNGRLAVQQGVFLCPGDVERCFQANLASLGTPAELRAHVRKVVFPAALVPEITRHLYRFGVTQASLYPGLDGFARSLTDIIAVPSALGGDDLDLQGVGTGL